MSGNQGGTHQGLEDWDDPRDPRKKLPWNRTTREFDAATGDGKKGIAGTISDIIKLKQDKEGSCWNKVTLKTKNFYWEKFKKKYKWDPQIDGDVRTAFMVKAAQRYKDLIYRARKEQKKWESEQHTIPFVPNWVDSSIWAAWNRYTETPEFERKSNRGKKNRRKGDLSAQAPGTYHCGSKSAARVLKEMEKEGNTKPSAYKFFYRTKGVADNDGNTVLVNDDDKRLDSIYNRMVDEHLRAGKTIDHNEIYLKACLELTESPKPPPSVYGMGSASQQYYPNLWNPTRMTADDRSAYDHIWERLTRQDEQIAELRRYIYEEIDTRIDSQQQQLDLLQSRLANVEHENARLKNVLSHANSTYARSGSSDGALTDVDL